MSQGNSHMQSGHASGSHVAGKQATEKHATVKQYWVLCVVLFSITAVEFGIFKVESLRSNAAFMVPTLLTLSLVKFVIVAGWYMHLRYDHKILTRILALSALMVIGVFSIVIFSL